MDAASPDVKTIFGKALEIESPEEQAAYLAEACGANAVLRAEVEELLQALDRAGKFLSAPAVQPQATVDFPPITEKPGAQIGPYKLLEQIGEGGFGVVYMAEQQRPVRRRVALKVIKPGMDTRQVIARFEAERQALALMDHPNIARVLDAGATDSGRPYFVMELVRGIPITDYCDQNRLSTRQRLELFASVCQAVQHAHQKGVIHRDIKPANVMVTLHDGKPVPKIIDFGVAKAIDRQLTERTLFTNYSQMIGTPLYMSPEQAEMSGLDVDTRTDIYSLGVLLYELLTGTTPFDRQRIREAAYDEIRRIIREEEPPKPSTRVSTLGDTAPSVSAQRGTDPKRLSQVMRGDLDWIVMKALEKDRTRRYETANGFAADVLRYLSDEPVVACPPSASYKFRKFARRNKAALSTAAGIAALLVLGTAVSTWQAIRAKQQREQADGLRRQAEANLSLARRAIDDMYRQMAGTWVMFDEPESTSKHELLERARNFYEQLARHSGDAPVARYKRAWAYLRLGDVHRVLGNSQAQDASYDDAIEILRSLATEVPREPRYRQALANAYWRTFEMEHLFQARELFEQLTAEFPVTDQDNPEFTEEHYHGTSEYDWEFGCFGHYMHSLAIVDMHLAFRLAGEGQFAEAGRLYRRSAELQEKVDTNFPDYPRYWSAGVPYMLLGFLLRDWGRVEEATHYLERAEEQLHAQLQRLPESPFLHWFHGRSLSELQRFKEAIDEFAVADELSSHSWGVRIERLAEFLRNHADSELRTYAVQTVQQVAALSPWKASSWQRLAAVALSAGDSQTAMSAAERAAQLDATDPENQLALAVARAATGAITEAHSALEAAVRQGVDARRLKSYAWALGRSPLASTHQVAFAVTMVNKAIELDETNSMVFADRAQYYTKLGELQKALSDANKAIELNSRNHLAWTRRAWIRNRLGEYHQAIADARQALHIDQAHYWAHRRLANAFIALKQYDELLEFYDKADHIGPGVVVAWENRARAHVALQDWRQAANDYTQMLRLHNGVDPNHFFYFQRGVMYERLGEHDKARDDFEKHVELLGKTEGKEAALIGFWKQRAEESRQAGRLSDAVEYINKAIELDKNDADALSSRGWYYRDLGKLQEALADLDRAVALDSQAVAAYERRASVRVRLGESESAIADAKEALKIDPSNYWAQRHLVNASIAIKRYDDAKLYATALIERDQNDAVAWRDRGRAYANLGRWKEAIDDYSRAIDLRPKGPLIPQLRGNAHAELGQWDEAATDLARAIELGQTGFRSRYELALVQLAGGNMQSWQTACAAMLEQFKDTENALTANFTAWTCALVAEAVPDVSPAVALAEKAVQMAPETEDYLNTQGAVLYRAGQYDEAIQKLTTLTDSWEKTGQMPVQFSPAYTWFFLAMAEHRQGNDEQARESLARGIEWTEKVLREHEQGTNQMGWNRRLTLRLLRIEAEALLRGDEVTIPEFEAESGARVSADHPHVKGFDPDR